MCTRARPRVWEPQHHRHADLGEETNEGRDNGQHVLDSDAPVHSDLVPAFVPSESDDEQHGDR